MEIRVENCSFRSDECGVDVSYTVFSPRDLAKGIIQIFHGVGEHMYMYTELARFLCEHGFVVCGCDMVGFGESQNGAPGYLGKGNKLFTPCQIQLSLYNIMRSKYRYLPYMFYANDIGNTVVKSVIYDYPDLADGIIYSGIISPFNGMVNFLSGVISLFKGKKGVSPLLEKLCFEKGVEKFAEEKDEFSYISSIEEIRKSHTQDLLCVNRLTAASIRQIVAAEIGLVNSGWLQGYPLGVYTLILCGENDPVSGYGKAAVDFQNELEEQFVSELECIIYKNSRHDIIHDVDKEKVFSDILSFVEKVVDGVNTARVTDREFLV